jgi:hypothetical protein
VEDFAEVFFEVGKDTTTVRGRTQALKDVLEVGRRGARVA